MKEEVSDARDKNKNTPKHVRIIKDYQEIWESVICDREKDSEDAILRAARNCGNFSGIEESIAGFLEEKPSKYYSILSLGCGAARDLAKMKELYPSSMLLGIDTSRHALSRAKSGLTGQEVNLICASMSHLPLMEDLRFDMLIAGQSLDLGFEESYLKIALIEVTRYSHAKCKFFIAFYGTDQTSLELYKCTPIGNLLNRIGWRIIYGIDCCHQSIPFSEGVFWVAERSDVLVRTSLSHL